MDAVAVLRQLWRSRLLVAVGLAVALVVGVIVAYQVTLGIPPKFESRQSQVGAASAAVLVDSESSQVVDLGGGVTRADVSTLSVRARLLANLLATSPLKDQIAARAGVRPDWLIAHPPAEGGPTASRTPEGPSATIRADDPRASILRLYVNETLPIITADVQAPDAATGARIAGAAVGELELYLNSATAANRVPDARKLVVSPLGSPRSATETVGQGRLLGFVLMFVVFGIWCAAIVAVSSIVRAWNRAEGDAQLDPPRVPLAPAPARERAVVEAPPARAAGGGHLGGDVMLRPEAPHRRPKADAQRPAFSAAPPVRRAGTD